MAALGETGLSKLEVSTGFPHKSGSNHRSEEGVEGGGGMKLAGALRCIVISTELNLGSVFCLEHSQLLLFPLCQPV